MPSTLLALETATDVCGVALARDGCVVVEMTLTRPRAHAENLAPMIRDALRYAGVTPGDLDAVAVSAGPGSYTGLRIGVSTAKGLAFSVGARLLSVPSLEALAASAAPMAAPGEALCTLFNARRHEVYAAVFLVTGKDRWEPRGETAVLPVDALPGRLAPAEGRPIWLLGEGVPRAVPVLKAAGLDVRPLDPAVYLPSAAWVARLADRKREDGLFEDIARFEPFYLKEFVAKKPTGSIFEKLSF